MKFLSRLFKRKTPQQRAEARHRRHLLASGGVPFLRRQ